MIFGHLGLLPEDYTYHILTERNTGIEATHVYSYLMNMLRQDTLHFYTEKGINGDVHPGLFLGNQKEFICSMFRDRVNSGHLRLASNFQPMCSARETHQPQQNYGAAQLTKAIENELKNFQCKLKFPKANIDAPPKLIYAGKKGYGFDDIVLAAAENNYFYWKEVLEHSDPSSLL